MLLLGALLSGGVLAGSVALAPRAARVAQAGPEISLQLQLAAQVTAACQDVLAFSEVLLGFGRTFWAEAGVVRSAALVVSVTWQASEGALVDAVDCWEGRGCVPDRFFADAMRGVDTALDADAVFRPRWARVTAAFGRAEAAALQAYETFYAIERLHPHVVAQTVHQLRDAIWSAAQQRVHHEAHEALSGGR